MAGELCEEHVQELLVAEHVRELLVPEHVRTYQHVIM